MKKPREEAVTKMQKKPLVHSTLSTGYERLERAMAHSGLASRREAKDLIVQGLVSVNGTVIREPGFGIKIEIDTIVISREGLKNKESYLIYKPKGIETTKTSTGVQDIHDVVPKFKYLSPIGRLDKESEGLIILTNDGTLTKALTKIDSPIKKEYVVTVRENITDANLIRMQHGIVLDRIPTKPTTAKRLGRSVFSITLQEGRKHQIRRMCDACHLTIVSLKRIAIGHLTIGDMKPGSYRLLPTDDVAKLKL